MRSRNPAHVLLVGYEDQDNLGLRYLSSRLKQRGHETLITRISPDDEDSVLGAINEFDPHVVGFSLIFQYLKPQFAGMIERLRCSGIDSHFTMGGHYPSFEYESLLRGMPGLDSVARFEAEDTLAELAERIAGQQPWQGIAGLAWRNGETIETKARAGRVDLDTLPWPDRDDIRYEQQALSTASVLGSRGCPWQCSFCSIITFYEGNGTKGRRRRDPIAIVDELEYLHRERGVEVILWQDDDFLAGGKAAIRWAHEIAAEAVRRKLHEGLCWKISCRSNEVRTEIIEPLVEAGLTHIYLGVEAGDASDLAHLNKLMHRQAHFDAAEVIRQFGLSFDFGFMLLNPWSTFETVRNNLEFLLEFVGDGSATVGFCRMLPYVGTQAESRLISEGRLKNHLQADYDFLVPQLDLFYEWMLDVFAGRNFSAGGTQNLLRLLLFETQLRLPDRGRDRFSRDILKCLVALDNENTVSILRKGLDYIEHRDNARLDDFGLQSLKRRQQQHDQLLRRDLASFIGQHSISPELMAATR